MILVTGAATSKPQSTAAFTLLEIILVFALIALTAGVMIANITTFLDFDERSTPEEALRAGIRSARFHAAREREPASLRFDKESGSLIVAGTEPIPLNANFSKEGRGEIRFYLVPPATGLDNFPDPKRTRMETESITFAPDRSSSPFVAEIDTGSGSPQRMVFDPFSSLVRSAE